MPFWMLWSQVHQQYKLCLNQHLQEHVLSQRVFRGNNLRQFKSRKSMRRQSALNPVRHVQRGLWAFLFEAYNPWICPVSQLICLTYGGSYSNHCSLGPEYVASTNSSLVKVSRKCLQRWMQLPGSSTPVAFFFAFSGSSSLQLCFPSACVFFRQFLSTLLHSCGESLSASALLFHADLQGLEAENPSSSVSPRMPYCPCNAGDYSEHYQLPVHGLLLNNSSRFLVMYQNFFLLKL